MQIREISLPKEVHWSHTPVTDRQLRGLPACESISCPSPCSTRTSAASWSSCLTIATEFLTQWVFTNCLVNEGNIPRVPGPRTRPPPNNGTQQDAYWEHRNPCKAFRIGTCVSLQTGTGQSEAPRQSTIAPQQCSSQLRVTSVTFWYFINASSPGTHVSTIAAFFLPADFTAPCMWPGWHNWRLPAESFSA